MSAFSKLIGFTCFIALLACLPANAVGGNSGVTYQGRILRPDGSPLNGATTQFKFQIRTPDSQDCLMYEEIQSLDLRNSNGIFSLTMNDGSGSRTDSTGLTLDRIFANRGTLTLGSTTCVTGSGVYSPNVSDGRNLVIQFRDETMSSWEPIPAQHINFAPYAFEAKQVAGFTADSLLRVVNGTGDPLTGISPLSNAQWTELQALIAGTSVQYTHAGQIAGSAAPAMTSGQVLGWNGSAWTSVDPLSSVSSFAKTAMPACAAGEYLRNNGSGLFACSAPPATGGTVTQVNTGTGLTGGGFTTTGTISIAAGGVGTTELAALAVTSAKIALQAVDTAQLKDSAVTTVKLADGNVTTVKLADGNVTLVKLAADSVDSSKILDGSIAGADLSPSINITTSGTVASGVSTTRDFKLYPSSGSFKINFAAPTLAADYTLTFPADDGAPSQVLTTDGNGNLTWTTPSGTGISALTGDVTASGSGSVAATVAAVGGSSAANVHTAELAANAATSANTASTIVKRDASGNFTAGTITSASNVTSSVVLKDSGSNTVTLKAPATVVTSYLLKMPTAVAPSTQLLQSDSTGQLSYVAMPSALPPNGAAAGDLSGTYPNPAVATVGTSTAANVHSGELLANAATSANTNSAIVKRDGSGNFVSNVGTFNGVTLNNGGSLLNILNPIGGAWTMTLPATAGSSGQVLTTDGAGVLSWGANTSASAFLNGGNSFGANSSIGNNDNFDFAFKTNNTTKMTVAASGRVGIGTTAPATALDVTGAISINGLNGLRFPGSDSSTGGSVAIGKGSLAQQDALASGAYFNTAVGYLSMSGTLDTTARFNTAVGEQTLKTNTTGSQNTAVGGEALINNTSGSDNTSVGVATLQSLTTGGGNTVIGSYAGTYIYDGSNDNTAVGKNAMYGGGAVTYGNTAIGSGALFQTGSGTNNTALGISAGRTNSSGSSNVFLGNNAGFSNSSGSGNIVIGSYTNSGGITTGSNNLLMGQDVRAPSVTASNQMNIGNLIYASGLASGTTASTGNVGIGTTSPSMPLQVAGNVIFGTTPSTSVYTAAPLNLSNNQAGTLKTQLNLINGGGGPGSGSAIDFYTYTDAGNGLPGARLSAIDDALYSAHIIFSTKGAGSSTSLNEKMRISSSGNVGIGTTSPVTKLQVGGSVLIGDGGETCGATYAGAIRYNGGNLQFCNGTPPWSTLGIAGSGITALTGDVTASGTGSVAATVASVGGSAAIDVHTAELAVAAATNLPTASKLVKRDPSGAIGVSSVIATTYLDVPKVIYEGGNKTASVLGPANAPSAYQLTLPNALPASSMALMSDAAGSMTWSALPSALPPNGAAGGDLNGTYPNPAVAQVGGVSAANVASGANAANAAVSANTVSTIVKRDGTGNFVSNVATLNGVTLNNAGSLLNIVNPVGGAWTMTLPATAGSSGQVLTTDGAGLLSWSAAGGSSQWTTQAPGINYIGGNVGIGTTSPNTRLTVDAASAGNVANAAFLNSSMANNSAVWTWFGRDASTNNAGQIEFNYVSSGSANNSMSLGFLGSGNKMTVLAGGNVGIGTTSPRVTLDVNGVIASKAATDRTSSTTIDFSSGNIQYTNDSCQPYQFNNLMDGATYTFVVKGTASATCSFTAYSDSGSTLLTTHLPPGHVATTTGKHTMYSLMVVGTDVYFSWIPGY